MTESEFKDLCRDASRALEIEEVDALGEYGRLELDEMEIAVFFNEELAPDRLFVYLDVGPMDEEQREQTMENLMTLNFLIGSRNEGVFGIDPSSGHILMIMHVPLSEVPTGDMLAEAFRIYTAQALSVRKSVVEEQLPKFDLESALHAEFGPPPTAMPMV